MLAQRQRRVLLVGVVADRARQVETVVDATVLGHYATGYTVIIDILFFNVDVFLIICNNVPSLTIFNELGIFGIFVSIDSKLCFFVCL